LWSTKYLPEKRNSTNPKIYLKKKKKKKKKNKKKKKKKKTTQQLLKEAITGQH
jgi:hypothetical protein